MRDRLLKLPRKLGLVQLLCLIAVSTTGGIVLYGFFTQPPPDDPIAQLQPEVTPKISALGRIEPISEIIKISPSVDLDSDQITQLLVDRGDLVEANQVVAILASRATLQDAYLESQQQVTLAQAKLAQVKAGAKSGELAAQQAQIERLRVELSTTALAQAATLERLHSEVKIAQAEYERYQSLLAEGAVPASAYDQKRLAIETAQALFSEAQADQARSLESLQAQIQAAQATLEQLAEVRPTDIEVAEAEIARAQATAARAASELALTQIRSPIAGQVIEIYTRSGEAIDEDGVLAVGQTAQMGVVAEIYQSDIGQIRIGQRAVSTSPAFSGKREGAIAQIGREVKQQSVFSKQPGENLDRRIVEVRFLLKPEDSQHVSNLSNLLVQADIMLDRDRAASTGELSRRLR